MSMDIGAVGFPASVSSFSTAEQPSRRKEGAQSTNGQNLNEEQQREVERLKARDREVRTHEMAHVTASSGLSVSGPSYEMTTGPDGQRYAVAGEVRIDTSEGRTPEETISKAQRIIAAALAPAEPSGQDIQVASKARQMIAEAQTELTRQRMEESKSASSGDMSKTDGVSLHSRQSLANYQANMSDTSQSGERVDTYA